MRCAIYARKSTDDSDKNEDLKSVEIQIAACHRFAEEHDWRVMEEHIYSDDNVSGARISRPKLDRMMAALGIKDGKRPRHRVKELPFDCLIVRDQSRLIRNSDHTTRFIKQIIRSGVQLWYYKDRRQVQLGFAEELSIGVQGQIDSARRIEASLDAREGLADRAAKGYNAGGCVYGYDNRPVMGRMASGQEKRLYTDFRINEEQANVVRRIFRMFAAGYGPRIIAKTLNGDPRYATQSRQFFDGHRPPKPVVGKRGSGSWAPTAVRGMLRNERYAGVVMFGRMKKEWDEDGEQYRIKQPDPRKIIRTERPDLRIVSADLWGAVQRRIDAERESYVRSTQGLLHGRPERGRRSRYLLSGFVRCGCCGASMVVGTQSFGSGATRRQVRCYVCNYRNHRGPTACSNGLRPMLDALDGAVLSAIERQVLSPAVVRAAIKRAVELIKAHTAEHATNPDALRRELTRLEAERARLLSAIRLSKVPLASLVAELTNIETQIEVAQRAIAEAANPSPFEAFDVKAVERELVERCARWREVLAGDVPLARQALRALMPERQPILLIPDRDGYRLRGATPLGALFAEAGNVRTSKVASPRGFATNSGGALLGVISNGRLTRRAPRATRH